MLTWCLGNHGGTTGEPGEKQEKTRKKPKKLSRTRLGACVTVCKRFPNKKPPRPHRSAGASRNGIRGSDLHTAQIHDAHMLHRGGGDERDLIVHHLLKRSGLLGVVPFRAQDHLFVPQRVGCKNALHEQLGRVIVLGDEAGGEVAPDQRELATIRDLGGDLAIPLQHRVEVGQPLVGDDGIDALLAFLVEEGEHGGDFGFGLHVSQFLDELSDEWSNALRGGLYIRTGGCEPPILIFCSLSEEVALVVEVIDSGVPTTRRRGLHDGFVHFLLPVHGGEGVGGVGDLLRGRAVPVGIDPRGVAVLEGLGRTAKILVVLGDLVGGDEIA